MSWKISVVHISLAALGGCLATDIWAAPQAPLEARCAETTVIYGVLTRQGPDRSSYWAETDANGKTWQLVRLTSEQSARFERLQNHYVVAHVAHVRTALREEVRVIDIAEQRR